MTLCLSLDLFVLPSHLSHQHYVHVEVIDSPSSNLMKVVVVPHLVVFDLYMYKPIYKPRLM